MKEKLVRGARREDGFYFVKYRSRDGGEEWASPEAWLRFRLSRIVAQAHKRAKAKGRPFNIDIDYAVSIFPRSWKCPVFGIPLEFGVNGDNCYDNSPSLDQIIPAAGYTRGNVRIISYRANVLRNNATIEELEMLLADAKKQ